MRIIILNTKKVLKDTMSLLIVSFSFILFGVIFYLYSDFALVAWNYSVAFASIEVWTEVLITFFGSLFFWASFYKIKYFRHIKKRHTTGWIIGSFFWILVGGCPACSITLASYLWLSSFLFLFPYWWLELKVIWLIILSISLYFTLRDLEVCKIKM